MHDILIEHDGLTAQIDYIIVTRKIVFLIECKNLYGNIEINNNGDFIRTMYCGNKRIREGIYSPITQNKRHMELLKEIKAGQKNKIMALAFRHWFNDNYKSVVVLANPKTVLNARYAKKEIKEQVIRADQLISYIKDECKRSKNAECNDKDLRETAENIRKLHRDRESIDISKYDKYMDVPFEAASAAASTELYKRLKEFRLRKSREENIKPYYIFNNKQLEELIEKRPLTKGELIRISGFGEVKTEKYGLDIIHVIKNVQETIDPSSSLQ